MILDPVKLIISIKNREKWGREGGREREWAGPFFYETGCKIPLSVEQLFLIS